MNNRKRNCLLLLIFLSSFVLSCGDKNLRMEKGFILFIDPQYWYYVPAAVLNDENYLNQFNSDNLGYGIQFRPFFEGRNRIAENLDTIPIDNFQTGNAPYLSTLKIVPVEIKYEIASEKISSSSIFEFTAKIRGKDVAFKFNTLRISIKDIHVMRE